MSTARPRSLPECRSSALPASSGGNRLMRGSTLLWPEKLGVARTSLRPSRRRAHDAAAPHNQVHRTGLNVARAHTQHDQRSGRRQAGNSFGGCLTAGRGGQYDVSSAVPLAQRGNRLLRFGVNHVFCAEFMRLLLLVARAGNNSHASTHRLGVKHRDRAYRAMQNVTGGEAVETLRM